MKSSRPSHLTLSLLFTAQLLIGASTVCAQTMNKVSEGELHFTAQDGTGLKLKTYGSDMVRVQHRKTGVDFLPDTHYEMVVDHKMGGSLTITEDEANWRVKSQSLSLTISKTSLSVEAKDQLDKTLIAEEKASFDNRFMRVNFKPDAKEKFTGFGMKPLADTDRLHVTGQVARRNYGEQGVPSRGSQGNLLVPFFISDKGYGLYFNTTFPNEFNFVAKGQFYAQFETQNEPADLDYFIIQGPKPAKILDQYTKLTGRPLLPPKWAFGLQYSDNEPGQNGLINADWWKKNVEEMYAKGFAMDHIVYDNDWREGSGGWSGSWFEFSKERYPDPAGFAKWYRDLGLTVTLDFNMNIANDSAGWKPEYNMPLNEKCNDDNSNSYPDYSNPEMRKWVWELFKTKAFDQKLAFPGEGIWIDEPDGIWGHCVAGKRTFDKRTWLENQNYYYFLIGKAIVQDGWMKDMKIKQGKQKKPDTLRPYVWIRGGSAGSQRFGTNWTGDIFHDTQTFQDHVIGVQSSGLAAFPYFNHDAGGFVIQNDKMEGGFDRKNHGLTDNTYVQWGMAFGSFTPIWRPHGYVSARWPIRRTEAVQKYAMMYTKLRYETMPYIYTAAIEAAQTGLPMASPMLVAYPDAPLAWSETRQYMWGPSMLVAPNTNISGRGDTQSLWLPSEPKWYDFWTGKAYDGDQVIHIQTRFGYIPTFVKAGGMIPRYDYALNTTKQDTSKVTLDVYIGADGTYTLKEDDGKTMAYAEGRLRESTFVWEQAAKQLSIKPAVGTYEGAPSERTWVVRFFGLTSIPKTGVVMVGGKEVVIAPEAASYKADTKSFDITVGKFPVTSSITVTYK